MAEKPEPGLADAYALKTPEDNRRLYRDWAATYDEGFAAANGYIYHQELAALFIGAGGAALRDVLDVGCGTGLVGAALRGGAPDAAIDGVDISPEMLSAARAKGVYRHLIEADLTRPPPPGLVGAYDGVISAGTFTHGHVGPEAMGALTAAARPGGVFAFGVNADIFASGGFEAKLDALSASGAIADLRVETGRVYAPGARHDHAQTRFQAALFRRAG